MPPDAGRRADAYFVCATPRTGSSLLLGLLESTGVAGRPQAYFRQPDEPLWADRWRIPRTSDGSFDYVDYVRAALAAGRTANGVFGAKLMWGTLAEVVDKLGPVHPDLAGEDAEVLGRVFGRTRFVYLRRDDVLAQAVSWLRAEQTGTWYVGDTGDDGRAPCFDAGRIGQLVRLIDEHNAAWEQWFASVGIEPHRVRYEELDADMVGVTRRILDFLGLELPDGHVIASQHRRQADGLNDEWIDRYRRGTSRGLPAGGVPVDDPQWRPWSPAEVARRLAAVRTPWYVAGGWALDLWLGEQTRAHDDIEIAVPAAGFAEIRAALPDHEFDVVGHGRRWPADDRALAANHQTWVREPATGVYRLDVFREPHDGGTWICRRDPGLRLPYREIIERTADGVPYLVPHLVLLFKAKGDRPKDRADLARALPALSGERRDWLAGALRRLHPGHPWLGPDVAWR